MTFVPPKSIFICVLEKISLTSESSEERTAAISCIARLGITTDFLPVQLLIFSFLIAMRKPSSATITSVLSLSNSRQTPLRIAFVSSLETENMTCFIMLFSLF